MMFSAGMPLLYPIFFFQVLIIYWLDKIICKIFYNNIFFSFEAQSFSPALRSRTIRHNALNIAIFVGYSCRDRFLYVFKHADIQWLGCFRQFRNCWSNNNHAIQLTIHKKQPSTHIYACENIWMLRYFCSFRVHYH